MKLKLFPFLAILGAGVVCALPTIAQTADDVSDTDQTPSKPPPDRGEVVNLDRYVVTSSADPKTAFDLAQGASVLTDKELRLHEQATLGETLADLPGVSATYYGPGASRPIIRGLGGDRVRMLENGVGALDLSNISPDHNVSIEPLLVERIEVLRGPATLLYGSSAVGGVVNVIDNTIPTALPPSAVTGQVEGRLDTAAHERTGVFTMEAGNGSLALAVNGLRTRTDDVEIPGLAQTGPNAPAGQTEGTLPSSAISTKSGSVGGSYVLSTGFVGVAVSDYETDYGVPTGDDPPTSISMRQHRFDSRAESTRPIGPFKGLKARLSFADYTHSELSGDTQVNTVFKNRAYEGRLELLQQSIGNLSGTLGLQTSRTSFAAAGDEVVTPPTVTYNHAVFALEEYKLNAITLQLGGRYEYQSIELGLVPDDLPAFPGFSASSGQKRTARAASFSVGAVYYPAKDYSLGFSMACSQRLPVAQELFSNGPHGGTAAYEVGTSDLGEEQSTGIDLTLRKRAGFVTGAIGVFANRFTGFIFEQQLPDSQKPVNNNPDDLTAFQFIAKNAFFYGGEMELQLHLVDTQTDRLHLGLLADYVHAEQTTDREPLPRIPPLRTRLELRYGHGPWEAGINLRHAFSQDRFTAFETATSGYTLIGADVDYSFVLGRVNYELFVRGTNLTDAEARVHTSFLKDFAPLPGRNFTFGVRANF